MNEEEDFEFDNVSAPEEAFHIELDLYEIGEYSNLLVIPCAELFIVVLNNEHLCTLIKTCQTPECWEQQDGGLEDDMVEKLGGSISGYLAML